VLVPPDQHLVGTRIAPSCLLDEFLFVQWSALHGLALATPTPATTGGFPRRHYPPAGGLPPRPLSPAPIDRMNTLGCPGRGIPGSPAPSGAGALLPVAQLYPADLSRDGLGEVGGELDLPRVLVGGGDGAAVLLELLDQSRGALVAGGEDDQRLDDLGAGGAGGAG